MIGALLGSYFFQMRGIEHQIRTSVLHEQRAKVIGRLYRLLSDAQLAFTRWIVPLSGNDKEEQIIEVEQRYNELAIFYYRHALWLEQDTRERVGALIDSMETVLQEFSVLPGSSAPSTYGISHEPRSKDTRDLSAAVNERVLDEMPDLQAQLQGEFQKLIFPRRWWRKNGS